MAIDCTTFIDESGNTGDNLKSIDQKFFTLAAVTVPDCVLAETSHFFKSAFNTVKEKEEIEVKAAKWIKSPKKCDAMKAIIECLSAHDL